MNTESSDNQLWENFCAADTAFFAARMELIRCAENLSQLIGRALTVPHQRGTALRLLEILPESTIREHLAVLVELASVGHSDIALCRSALLLIERNWLVQQIEEHVLPLLSKGDEEEYRRIAELYEMLDDDLLERHLARCAASDNSDINEIATDFAEESSE